MRELAGSIRAAWGASTGSDVESAVFGTRDADEIAAAVAAWAHLHLDSPVVDALWYRASVGCSSALVLDDRRIVVVKAHQPRFTVRYLDTAVVVQRHLHSAWYPCPEPIGAPRALGLGYATATSWLKDPGRTTVPDVVSAVAALARLSLYSDGNEHRATDVSGLATYPLDALAGDALYPDLYGAAHSFDPSAEVAWIDEYARVALATRSADLDPLVVTHADWSPANVRGDRFGVSAVFDMDSLTMMSDARAAGTAALSWNLGHPERDTPLDLAAMEHFLWLYQRIRDQWSTPEAERVAWGAALWQLAYRARCEQAEGTSLVATEALREHGDALGSRC